jgi:transcriptional regulator with XRE-family HTH domain
MAKTISPLGRRIRELLHQHRMSGRELGRQLGVSSGTVSHWCFDTWPGFEAIQRLAEVFGVPPQNLLGGYEGRSSGLNREVFSAASRVVRKALSERGLAMDKVSSDLYDHLVILAYERAMAESIQGAEGDALQETLGRYLTDLVPLISALHNP